MYKQEIFNRVYLCLAAQNFERSIAAGGTCAYRGAAGRKCAIGHLISDQLAQRLDDSNGGLGTSLSFFAIEQWPEIGQELGLTQDEMFDLQPFLRDLQKIHDAFPSDVMGSMRSRLELFAAGMNLTVPAIPGE